MGIASLERDAVSRISRSDDPLSGKFPARNPGRRPLAHLALRLWGVGLLLLRLGIAGAASASQNSAPDQTTVFIVVGAAGETEYSTNFLRQATLWQATCVQARAHSITIGFENSATNDLEALRQALERQPKQSAVPLWLVL